MKSSKFFSLLLALLICAGCAPEPLHPADLPESSSEDVVEKVLSSADPEEYLALFEYDRTAPLNIRESSRSYLSNGTLIELSYSSPKGGRVPALLILPSAKAPFPAVIFQHGSLGHKEDLISLGDQFASYGAAAFMIDDPYSRPGGWAATEYMGQTWPYYTSQDMDVKIQTIIDLQRAVDLLSEHPQIDRERIAYMGLSYGAAMGGLLAGVETRIQAYVLNVGDGGLVEHSSNPGPDGFNVHFSPDWAEMMWPTESINFVSRAAPAALLFQNGLQDENVPPPDAVRYQLAGSEPKTIRWYDSAHNLPTEAYHYAATWLQPYLGFETSWFAPNYRSTTGLLDISFKIWIGLTLGSVLALFLLWMVKREEMPFGVRAIWFILVLFTGFIGLGMYVFTQQPQPIVKIAGKNKQALLVSATLTTPAVFGLILADIWSEILPPINALLLLAIQYLTMIGVALLFYRSLRSNLKRSATGTLFSINLTLALTLIIGNSLASPLGLGQEPELAIWWPLAVTTLAAILVNYPLHLWLVHRGSEAWHVPLESSDESQDVWIDKSPDLPRAAATAVISVSYLAILAGIFVITLQQSGLSLAALIEALFG